MNDQKSVSSDENEDQFDSVRESKYLTSDENSCENNTIFIKQTPKFFFNSEKPKTETRQINEIRESLERDAGSERLGRKTRTASFEEEAPLDRGDSAESNPNLKEVSEESSCQNDLFSIDNLSLYTVSKKSSILKNYSSLNRESYAHINKKSIFSNNLVDLNKIKWHLIQEKSKNLINRMQTGQSFEKKRFYEEIIKIIVGFEGENELKRKQTVNNSLKKFKTRFLEKSFLKNQNEMGDLSDQKPGETTCVFYPNQKFTLFWQMLISVLLFYVTFMLTYELTFISNPSLFFEVSEYITSVIFFLDVLFNLNLAFYNSKQKLIVSRKRIVLRYLKFWFWLDMVSAFPFFIFSFFEQNHIFQNVKTTKIFKYFKIVRLSRLVKFVKNLFPRSQKESYKFNSLRFKSNIFRLMKHLLVVMILSHFFACIFYSLPLSMYPQTNWLVARGLQDKSPFEKYLFSMHWMIETVITVGYGEVKFR